MDPVVLFFVLGALAGLMRSDLKIPESFYNVLSIYLLLSIGIRGGMEMQKTGIANILLPASAAILLSITITALAFVIARKMYRFSHENAVALSAHYGSVSAVTFAVVISFLKSKQIAHEEYMTVLLVMMEVPAIISAVFYHKMKKAGNVSNIKKVFHEVFLGKSILLLVGGLIIGSYIEYAGNSQFHIFFFDLFKGFLAIFMLEMGIIASARMSDLKKAGIRVLLFGITMPLLSGFLGVLAGSAIGLSVGGTTIIATMAASASYIAAPAAMQIAVKDANPTFYLTAALGVTFPFNLLVGIHIYHYWSAWIS
jgi:hypothetical protein